MLCSLSLVGIVHAGKIDEMFKATKIVDSHYKITDHEKADILFKMINQLFVKKLAEEPLYVDEDMQLQKVSSIITSTTVLNIFKLNKYSNRREAYQIRDIIMLSKDETKLLCKDYFKDKFFEANNYQLIATLKDKNDIEIGSWVANKEVCEPYRPNSN